MGDVTGISWCHHTVNGWIGCTPVGPECDNCYAEREQAIWLGRVEWGAGKARYLTKDANWKKPAKWDREAREAGVRRRMFAFSLSDIFDTETDVVPEAWRERFFFETIAGLTNIDVLALTKRDHAMLEFVKKNAKRLPRNIWWGATAGYQGSANTRGPRLVQIKREIEDQCGYSPVTWLSIEPQLGPVSLRAIPGMPKTGKIPIDWGVVGGESGPMIRRPLARWDPQWGFDFKVEAADGDVKLWMKQTGDILAKEWALQSRTGKDIAEWPDWMRVQELPLAA